MKFLEFGERQSVEPTISPPPLLFPSYVIPGKCREIKNAELGAKFSSHCERLFLENFEFGYS